MTSIFISYRREDSEDITGRIYDSLTAHFPSERVFIDIDDIPLGIDFRKFLADRVQACDVVLVIIGRDWLHAENQRGQRRLDDRGDFVRIEIESALERDIPVIPVLVRRAVMPVEDDLPESLRSLAYRNGIPVRSGLDFKVDMNRLIGGIQRLNSNFQLAVTAKPQPAISTFPALPPLKNIHGWSDQRVKELQQQIAAALGSDVVFRDRLDDGTEGPPMVVIPAGIFLMGSPESESERNDIEIQHEVTISTPFALGQTTVTFAEYDRFAKATGREQPDDENWGREVRPVINVSWKDATAYADWLSQETGKPYRLPTEAEWEFACRAGSTGPFWFGNQITAEQVNYDGDNPYSGGKKGLYRGKTVPVKELPCNSWGLYQMHGNVWEWCFDWFSGYPKGAVADPAGPDEGDARVLRGGSWFNVAAGVRSAQRRANAPGERNRGCGFRLARGQAVR